MVKIYAMQVKKSLLLPFLALTSRRDSVVEEM
jgi:hypothetical protein